MKLKIIFTFFLLLSGSITLLAQEEWSLQRCIDSALVHNKKLQIDMNNVLISEAKEKEIKSNLLPKIKGTIDYKYFFDLPTQLMPAKAFNPTAPDWQFKPAQFGVPHNINANIQAGMPLYNATLLSGIKTGKIATELNLLKQKRTEEDIYESISDLYYNAQIIRNQLAFIKGNISNTQKLLDNLKLLKEQQLATGTDVNKVALQIQSLDEKKEVLNSKYRQVLDALQINMGINTRFNVVKDINYTATGNYSKNKLTDIQMVETKQKLVDRQLKTLCRGLLPSVALYGSYGQTGYGYDEKPNDFLDFYDVSFVGLKIDVPLFDISTKHKIKQKKLERQNVDLQLDLLTEQNDIQTEGAERQLRISLQNIANTKAQIQLAQSIYDNTLLQHKQEIASLNDVLMADTNLRQAQQNYIESVVAYLKTQLELKKLTGNLF